ncbi:MAG: SWIM zinc finger family protein [Sarcina sp.]
MKKYARIDGFIEYKELFDFVGELEFILEKVSETKDVLVSLDMAFLLLKETIESFQYTEDSGELGYLAEDIIGTIGQIAINIDKNNLNLRKNVFNKILTFSEERVFVGWEEYRIDLLRIFIRFTDIEELREKFIEEIKRLINVSSKNHYNEYSVEQLHNMLLEVTEEYGTVDKVHEFIQVNLNLTTSREMIITKYINENNYEKVIELALEGEEKDREDVELSLKWKNMRYDAYKKLSLRKEQKILAKELLLNGDFEYYNELKELNIENQELFYNELKNELKYSKKARERIVYAELIEEENDLDEIMELVRINPSFIEDYADKLIHKFKDEIMDIYKAYIKERASYALNRKEYQEVCRILKKYKKIAGKEYEDKLKNNLIALYKKKPAFLDELSKIK